MVGIQENMECNICGQVFRTKGQRDTHKYRNKLGQCKAKADKRKLAALNSEMKASDIIDAVEKKQKNEKNEETLDDLKLMMAQLLEKNEEQNKKISELKDMMVDMQNNPRLMVICNKLYPIEQLNLLEPQFRPALEILDNELPEYANLANVDTGRVHAKAIKLMNSIKPTAIQEGEDVFFKTENVLAKDTNNVTTKAFIEAIGTLGYEYAQKASNDLKSERESDMCFKEEVLSNAKKNAIPMLHDIDTV